MAERVATAPSAAGTPRVRAVPRGRLSELVRFLLVGGSNTVATLPLFVLLQQWMGPALAYTVVFALGLAYTTTMTATVVFGARLTWRTATAFVGWYLSVYGVGLAVVALLHPALAAVTGAHGRHHGRRDRTAELRGRPAALARTPLLTAP
ncbi:MAG: hypothetical protein AVDCRST_MAG52-2747 [uncultured Blastococcus sp.]|uniref:GtrA/DPMS transmembrane domain-containing protein n=1 Tax=uncultured Blastococcus sp. TaxID=217144 RepID=A0A6J4J0R9_9ACTN|nr:MAG: hypothetical protein AVDCRST_MAG52-2747 [uncultured Blastococcus sp.]